VRSGTWFSVQDSQSKSRTCYFLLSMWKLSTNILLLVFVGTAKLMSSSLYNINSHIKSNMTLKVDDDDYHYPTTLIDWQFPALSTIQFLRKPVLNFKLAKPVHRHIPFFSTRGF